MQMGTIPKGEVADRCQMTTFTFPHRRLEPKEALRLLGGSKFYQTTKPFSSLPGNLNV